MEPMLGMIIMGGWNFAPRGWAACNGQLLAISQNEALFSLLGTTYGGDGRTTFALPDLRGRVPMHYGSGPGLSSHSLGSKGGAESVALNVSEMPAHNHIFDLGLGAANTDVGTGKSIAVNTSGDTIYTTNAPNGGATLASTAITSTGGNQAHYNMQPYTCVNFVIALEGIFPSRN